MIHLKNEAGKKAVIGKCNGNIYYHYRAPSHDVSRKENLSREQANHTIGATDTNSINPTYYILGYIIKPPQNQLEF